MSIAEIYHSGLIGAHLPPATDPANVDPRWIPIGYLAYFLCALLPYLIGSINFGVLLSKKKYGDDVRNHGSGNAGATNMLRTYGKGAGIATLCGDFGKAIVACTVGSLMMGIVGAYIAGLFCVIGHAKPIWFHFKGGKGVAVTAAVVLFTSPLTFAIVFSIFLIIVLGTKYVSLASVMSAILYPLVLNMIGGPGGQMLFAIAIAVIVVVLHRENIKRLYHGEENKINLGKKKKKSEKPSDEDDGN